MEKLVSQNGSLSWNIELLMTMGFNHATIRLISLSPINNSIADTYIWSPNHSGTFSEKSTYRQILFTNYPQIINISHVGIKWSVI